MRTISAKVTSAFLILSLLAAPTGVYGAAKAVGVPRDTHGRIARSEAAKREFLKTHKCPTGERCVVDHIRPLACGGSDTPDNMQLQTVQEAKAKDRWEMTGPGCPR